MLLTWAYSIVWWVAADFLKVLVSYTFTQAEHMKEKAKDDIDGYDKLPGWVKALDWPGIIADKCSDSIEVRGRREACCGLGGQRQPAPARGACAQPGWRRARAPTHALCAPAPTPPLRPAPAQESYNNMFKGCQSKEKPKFQRVSQMERASQPEGEVQIAVNK